MEAETRLAINTHAFLAETSERADSAFAPPYLEIMNRIGQPDPGVAAEVQRALDNKTKPPGSLGRLEALAVQYAAMGRLPPLIVVAGTSASRASTSRWRPD